MKRFWFYWYTSWQPQWYHYFIPYFASDEYGRRTIVWPIHPFGWVVIPYRVCICDDCENVRIQTARWEMEAQRESWVDD